ncbi:hypothetical protein AQUCO_01700548v1, partial [Aquilegia coerulea]
NLLSHSLDLMSPRPPFSSCEDKTIHVTQNHTVPLQLSCNSKHSLFKHLKLSKISFQSFKSTLLSLVYSYNKKIRLNGYFSICSIYSITPTTRLGQGGRADLLLSSVKFPRHQQRSGSLQVRCMAEEKLPEQPTPVSSTSTPPPASQTPVTPPPAPKMSTKFSDVLAFSGPAPERINGRLAMIGFVAAIAAELAQGQDVVDQIANGGVPWFVGTSVLLTVASLIPMFKGVSVESKSKGLMTSDAELLNGRFAMLGLVALVFTEFVTGSALV